MKPRYYRVTAWRVKNDDEHGEEVDFDACTSATGDDNLLEALNKAAVIKFGGVKKGVAIGVIDFREIEAPVQVEGTHDLASIFSPFLKDSIPRSHNT